MTAHDSVVFICPHPDLLDPAGSGGQNCLYYPITEISKTKDTIVVGPAAETSESDGVGKIQWILDYKNRREQIGSNGREVIEERYNWKTIGERLDDIYTELATGK